jgi:hypothetical protein
MSIFSDCKRSQRGERAAGNLYSQNRQVLVVCSFCLFSPTISQSLITTNQGKILYKKCSLGNFASLQIIDW